jgi:hypothetical protein
MDGLDGVNQEKRNGSSAWMFREKKMNLVLAQLMLALMRAGRDRWMHMQV